MNIRSFSFFMFIKSLLLLFYYKGRAFAVKNFRPAVCCVSGRNGRRAGVWSRRGAVCGVGIGRATRGAGHTGWG